MGDETESVTETGLGASPLAQATDVLPPTPPKVCNRCGVVLTRENWRDWGGKKWAHNRCRACSKVANHESYTQRRPYQKSYEARNKERLKVLREKWAVDHALRRKEICWNYANRIKRIVLSHYNDPPGGKPKCCRCPFDDIRALCLDHKDDNGGEERRRLHRAGIGFYQYLIKAGFPAGYQVMCLNCNWIKLHEKRDRERKRLTLPNQERDSL